MTEHVRDPEIATHSDVLTGYALSAGDVSLPVYKFKQHAENGGEQPEEIYVATDNPTGLDELAEGGLPQEPVTLVQQTNEGRLAAWTLSVSEEGGLGISINVVSEVQLDWAPHSADETAPPHSSGEAIGGLLGELQQFSLASRVAGQGDRAPDIFEPIRAGEMPWEQQQAVDAWIEGSNPPVSADARVNMTVQLLGSHYAQAVNGLSEIHARPWKTEEEGAVYGINVVANNPTVPWQDAKEDAKLQNVDKVRHATEVLALYEDQTAGLTRQGEYSPTGPATDAIDEMLQVVRQDDAQYERLRAELSQIGFQDQSEEISSDKLARFLHDQAQVETTTDTFEPGDDF